MLLCYNPLCVSQPFQFAVYTVRRHWILLTFFKIVNNNVGWWDFVANNSIDLTIKVINPEGSQNWHVAHCFWKDRRSWDLANLHWGISVLTFSYQSWIWSLDWCMWICCFHEIGICNRYGTSSFASYIYNLVIHHCLLCISMVHRH